jgi:hypothetical protein
MIGEHRKVCIVDRQLREMTVAEREEWSVISEIIDRAQIDFAGHVNRA